MRRQLILLWDIVYGTIISLAIVGTTRAANYAILWLETALPTPGADAWYDVLKLGLNIIGVVSAIVVYSLLAAKSVWEFVRDWRKEMRQSDEPKA